jgi:hypothetical protein
MYKKPETYFYNKKPQIAIYEQLQNIICLLNMWKK